MEQGKSGRTEPHYYSDRLKHKLDKLRFASAAVVEAPSGYGKTTAIRDYFEAGLSQGTPVYWFTATDEVPVEGFRRLCREIEKIDRNAGERLLKIELPNAVTIGEAIDALKSIRCMHEAYLVIDNFQILHDVLPPAFFVALFEHGGEGLHIIVVTQMLKRNMLAVITGHGYLHIGTADLKLSTEDICCYYALADVNITIEDAQDVARYTEGWIIAVYLQLRAFRETGKLSDTVGILVLMESLVWDKLTEEQKTFLLYLSPFAMVTIQQVCAIIGCGTLPEYAWDTLASPFIRYEPAERQYELHSILTDLLIQKRRERGAVFERECLLRAGDFCRHEGKTAEALGFYAQISDYERMLSLDLSNMILETIGGRPFVELARDIAHSCPADIKGRHMLSMLQIAWAFLMAGMKDQSNTLMDELYGMPELMEDSRLYGEWLLLSSYRSFPDMIRMTTVLKQAAPFFQGNCSRVILSTAPWCFGNYSPLAEFHTRPGEADREADELEEYIAVYSRLTNGHGCGGDVLFRTELAYQRGDLKDAEIFAYKTVFLAESKQQSIVQLGATMQLAEIALHKADSAGWQHAISSMERAASFTSQNNIVIRSVLDIIRGVLLGELQFHMSIADWLQKGDFPGHRLSPNLAYNAMFVHLFYLLQHGEYERLIGTAEALQMEYVRARPFSEHLFYLTTAVSHLSIGNRAKAAELVEHAAERALPDGLVFTFASFSVLLQGLTDEVVKQKYPLLLEKLQAVKERFHTGWGEVHNAMSQDEIPVDLTQREYEVAKLAAEGLRNSEIAEKLMVTESTVRTHLRTIFQKLDIDRRTRLAEKLK